MEKFAGRSLQDLLQEYTDYLMKDFLPFMDRHVVDAEFGGFMCHTHSSGRNLSTNKRTWYDGRGIWVYSFLYKHVDAKAEYLEIAKKTVDLVLRAKDQASAYWPWSYDRSGTDLKEHQPDLYGNLFVAEGLSEYASASGEMAYWDHAKDILLQCMQLYDKKGYSYLLEYSPLESYTNAERVLGHWMIMLRLSTNLLRIQNDSVLQEINNRCVDALINKHYNPRYKLMNEVLAHDFSQVSDVIEQFVYIGHAIESLWMLMDEALRRGDQALFDLSSERFKHHVEVAWDDVYGGVLHCLDHVDQNQWLLQKVLWAQEEVLVGLMILIEHRNDPWAIRWFDKMYAYVVKTFPLQDQGSPLWQIGGKRQVELRADGERVENFHHPRHLMLNLLSLKRIIEREI